MVYKIVFRDQSGKAFEGLDRVVRRQVGMSAAGLRRIPGEGQATQLVRDPRTWRVRAGDQRVLYEIHDDEIVGLIHDVEHRSKGYGGR